jgi:hypothetical protein
LFGGVIPASSLVVLVAFFVLVQRPTASRGFTQVKGLKVKAAKTFIGIAILVAVATVGFQALRACEF